MHGGRSQSQSKRALHAFASGRAQALIATDVAARGIHIDAVESVIHFDPAGDHKDYLHRSGRTARAGAAGTVVSLVTSDQERAVRRMQRELNLHAPIEKPQLDALHHGGHRIGESSPKGSPTGAASTRPTHRPGQSTGRIHGSGTRESIYVANLPWGVSEDDISALFGRYGEVHQTTIISDRKTGRSRGFGFVDMPPSAARAAIQNLDGWALGGRHLTVRTAKPRSHRS